jgi:hypothetical protein
MSKIKTALDDFKPDPRLIDERGLTDERKARAGDDFHAGEGGRMQVRDAPLERMERRGTLGRDEQENRKHYNGLNKFRIHWHHAGMAGNISALDPNHIFASDITNFSGLAKTEQQLFHRDRYRQATQAMGIRVSSVVEAVICYEKSLDEAGKMLTWSNGPQARAAATEVLRGAADTLCRLWSVDS